MKDNFKRERSYFQLKRYKLKEYPKSVNRNESNSQSKSIEKLSELNLDIEKLYKKYAEIKKERLMKEKSQQILVNRLKVLHSQQNSSKNKNLRNSEKYKKIHVKINSKYKNNNNIVLRKYRFPGKNKNKDIEIRNNYRTINDNESRKEKIKSSINTNSNNSGSENRINGSFIENTNINNIDDFLKKFKYNIGNKNSNNNIYIIINNPNNFPDTKTLDNNNYQNDNKYNDDNTPKDKTNNNNGEKNIKSDMNVEFDGKDKKIILMNTEGRKIEDIIKSINNINNTNENIKEKEELKDNNTNGKEELINTKNIAYSISNDEQYNKKDLLNKDLSNNKLDKKENNKINEYNEEKELETYNKINEEKKIEKKENEDLENKRNKDEKLIEENKNNQSINNNISHKKNNDNFVDCGKKNEKEVEEIKSKDLNSKNEEKYKKIEIINNNEEKNDNSNKDFIRPNFLDLYKNEDSGISKQKIDINIKDISPINCNIYNKIINNEKLEDNNKNYNIKSITPNEKNESLNPEKNNKFGHDSLANNKNHSDLNKIKFWKRISISSNINSIVNNSSGKNDNINLSKKKPEDICDNYPDKSIKNNIILESNNENNKNKMIYTDDRKKNKKLISENLYTPKKLEPQNKVRVNKKIDKSLTNQRAKNYKILRKNNNIKFQNNNYMNYSLSFTNLNSNKSSISSSHNYNTKRNLNLEKYKNGNYRKDNYCTSIERKRKALGLQFKPNIEKELSIQNDKNKRKINVKFSDYKIIKKNIRDNSLNKNKVIKVNKRGQINLLNINMKGINATPQRLRIFKKNMETKNSFNFVKNKTITNFNYVQRSINFYIKNNLNDLKNSNLRKINKILPNFSLSENHNNSSSQINYSNYIGNKTLNNN